MSSRQQTVFTCNLCGHEKAQPWEVLPDGWVCVPSIRELNVEAHVCQCCNEKIIAANVPKRREEIP